MTTETELQSISFSALPALGHSLAGGIFRGITTTKDGSHCAVVRLPDVLPASSWAKAKAAVKKVGGQLPSKAVGALLASNEKLERGWYWTDEEWEGDASCAWVFDSDGFTLNVLKSAAGGALAVRLIPITA
ncbi:MAG: hypothetical protein ACK4F4_07195 [Hylemonella sp.]|uniref:hypothetical protein n=1 Tax=Hylemonella sp. TaxID=2066020 RepID=UPI00391CADB6